MDCTTIFNIDKTIELFLTYVLQGSLDYRHKPKKDKEINLKRRKMKTQALISTVAFGLFISSCSNEDSTTLTPTTPPPANTTKVTYNQNIKTIMDNNCIVCHATVPRNGAPNSLVTFAQVKEAMTNRGLLNRISLQNGSSLLMPQGGPRMPQTTIDLVTKWQQDGLLE